MEREVRYLPLGASGIEVRTGENGAKGIRGTASVTRSVSQDLGGFTEEIEPGAYEAALARSDVRILYNHNSDFVLGRDKRTAKVWADENGMHYEVFDMPASRADVLEAIQRGDVDGSSFSFTVAEGGDKWTTRSGKPHRTITAFEEFFDAGPVAFPAYPEATVSSRSLDMAKRMAESPPEPEPEPEPKPEPATKDELEALRRRLELLEATQEG